MAVQYTENDEEKIYTTLQPMEYEETFQASSDQHVYSISSNSSVSEDYDEPLYTSLQHVELEESLSGMASDNMCSSSSVPTTCMSNIPTLNVTRQLSEAYIALTMENLRRSVLYNDIMSMDSASVEQKFRSVWSNGDSWLATPQELIDFYKTKNIMHPPENDIITFLKSSTINFLTTTTEASDASSTGDEIIFSDPSIQQLILPKRKIRKRSTINQTARQLPGLLPVLKRPRIDKVETKRFTGFDYFKQQKRDQLHSNNEVFNWKIHIAQWASEWSNFDKATKEHYKQSAASVPQRKEKRANCKYICDICKQGFRSTHSLRSHVANMHPANTMEHKCDQCSKSYTSKPNLNLHKKNTHQTLAWSCKYCEKKFQLNHACAQHMKICIQDKSSFQFLISQNPRMTSFDNISGRTVYTCRKCLQSYWTATGRSAHENRCKVVYNTIAEIPEMNDSHNLFENKKSKKE